jgi:hypothetical protein
VPLPRRAAPRPRSRAAQGKPYLGEDWKELWAHGMAKGKKEDEEAEKNPPPFSKAFQAYLDTVAKTEKEAVAAEGLKNRTGSLDSS